MATAGAAPAGDSSIRYACPRPDCSRTIRCGFVLRRRTRSPVGSSGANLPHPPTTRFWDYKYFCDAIGASGQVFLPELKGMLRGEIAYEIGVPENKAFPKDVDPSPSYSKVITGTTERDQKNVGITFDRPLRWNWLQNQTWLASSGIIDTTIGWFGQTRFKEECEDHVATARLNYLKAGVTGRMTVADAKPEDWKDCGQCRDCFNPAFNFRPGNSGQYALALSNFDDPANPRRFNFGFIASSDNHTARPGTGYKEYARRMMTEATGAPDEAARTRLIGATRPRQTSPRCSIARPPPCPSSRRSKPSAKPRSS